MSASADRSSSLFYSRRHLLGIEGLTAQEIDGLIDLSDSYVEQNRRADKKDSLLHGRTVINFFETSTRTRTSFELAAKRWAPMWSTCQWPPARSRRARRCWTRQPH
jgi:aspartate carbamoyltransferase catalytic subunit